MRLRIENESSLVRDSISGAVINIDSSGYDKYMRASENLANNKKQVTQIVGDVKDLQSEIAEIKLLLINILSRYGDHNS